VASTTIGLLSIIFLLILLIVGTPIGVALGVTGALGIWYLNGLKVSLGVLAIVPYRETASWLLTVVPLFVLMGELAHVSEISREIYFTAHKWLGRLPGGLAMATVLGNAGFGFASGSTVAAAATFTRIALPEMDRLGYDRKQALGCIAAGGTLSALIPPSIALVIYGIVTEQSIGELLIAGIIPGIVSAGIYMGMIFIRGKINPQLAPAAHGVSWKEKISSLRGIWGILLLGMLVLGSIYTGFATPTEAGAIGAFGSLLIAFTRSKLTLHRLMDALLSTGRTTCSVFIIFIGAMIFSVFFAVSGVPSKIAFFIQTARVQPIFVLIGVYCMFIFLGMFIDTIAMQLLTLPIVFPIVLSLGYNPIWFGIMVVKMVEVGLITPPFGLNVYVVKGAAGADVNLGDVFRGIWPFLAMDFLTISILTAFPQMTLWLPGLMQR